MLAATSKFLRQIVPPVIATLIAAVLIAGFNSAFQTHLVQPRMAALHPEATTSEPAPARAAPAAPAIVADVITEPVIDRLGDKGGQREATKDHPALKLAEATPTPAAVRRTERVAGTRPEPRAAEPYVAAVPLTPPPVIATPVIVAAPPVVAAPAVKQQPVFAEPPTVTVPDRPRPLPQVELQEPAPAPENPIGAIANTLKPSSLFARAREFGEKIEAAGNEILPSIRQ
jgi:hypothetical protein